MCSSSVDMRWESTQLIVNRSMSISHCPDFHCLWHYISQLTYNKMRRTAFSPTNMIRLPRRSWHDSDLRGHRPISPILKLCFSERWGPQTGTLRPAHAVYETPAPLPAVIFRLGPAASDQSATVLLLLCRTWRVSDTAEASLSLNVLFSSCVLFSCRHFLSRLDLICVSVISWIISKLHAAYQMCQTESAGFLSLFWLSCTDVWVMFATSIHCQVSCLSKKCSKLSCFSLHIVRFSANVANSTHLASKAE